MKESQLAIKRIDMGECPHCRSKQFYVSEIVKTNYLLNRDGTVIDSEEPAYDAVGICIKCGKQYQMKPVFDGFVPLTPLRKYMEENINIGSNTDPLEVDDINNPMQLEV